MDRVSPLKSSSRGTQESSQQIYSQRVLCQATMVRVGELFGEFGFHVFAARRDSGAIGLLGVTNAAAEEGSSAADGAASANAAGLPREIHSRVHASDKIMGQPIRDCVSAGIPRWQLLVVAADVTGTRGGVSSAIDTSAAGWEYAENPAASDAEIVYDRVLPSTTSTKVVKLEPGRRYAVLTRCFLQSTSRWSGWSDVAFTATQHPVQAQIADIGSDYVYLTWDRVAQRCLDGLSPEVDTTTSLWERSIPNFQLKVVRETDMHEQFASTFEAGCRTHTVRGLDAGTAYVVFMRYETMIHTMREWAEVGRFYTEGAASIVLDTRGEDTFSFHWLRGSLEATNTAGYHLPSVEPYQYEITIESPGLRFDPVTVSASTTSHTVKEVYPSTEYTITVRCLSVEGRWGGRSLPLHVRTADIPSVRIEAVGESFASFSWNRAHNEPSETAAEYRVQSVNSDYKQQVTVDLDAEANQRILHAEHLRAGSDYLVSLRTHLDGVWGKWTEPLRLSTLPCAALVFLERGEDFFTVDWPTLSGPQRGVEDADTVYNIVVVKCGQFGERTAVLNERVPRRTDQKGFRVGGLEADTSYDVQCRTLQRNALTQYEGWGEFSPPMRVKTLQPVALHVWDVGEDFVRVVWRRGLSDKPEGHAAGEEDAAAREWGESLKYEVVVGCVDTAEDEILHRQVLETSYTINHLKPATTYMVSVRACDGRGQWGLWSKVKVCTLSSIVTHIHEIGEDFVRILWQRDDRVAEARKHTLENEKDDVMTADLFIAKYSVFVYAKELPGVPVEPHTQSGYEAGGGLSEVARHEVVSNEHTSLRIGDLVPDREYVAVVRAATASGKWGLWSSPLRFRTIPQLRVDTNHLTIGENYINISWSREMTPSLSTDDEGDVEMGNLTVTAQQLRIQGVQTQFSKEYALGADVSEMKVYGLLPASAYAIQLRACGKTGCWGLWSPPLHILTRDTIVTKADEVAEDAVTVSWERRKLHNPSQYPTGRGVVTSYHLRVHNSEGVHKETFLGDGDCPYRVTGLKPNTFYCVEMKANYNDEEWGLWSRPLWCLTMQPMNITAKLISEEFCCLALSRPSQQRRLPEDDGNVPTSDRSTQFGQIRPAVMLCVTSPGASKAPYSPAGSARGAIRNDALPPDAADHRLIYQTELINPAEMIEHTVSNLKCNTVYYVSARTKLPNGDWGMWCPSLRFATVPTTCVSFTAIGESFLGVRWVRGKQTLPPSLPSPESIVMGVATISASRVRVRESGGTYQHTYLIEGATNSLRMEGLSPSTTYLVSVQTFNDNYEWGVWSEEWKVRTVPGIDITIEHSSEDAMWASWVRRSDIEAPCDTETALNVSVTAKSYEICVTGDGGFSYSMETEMPCLFFRGLLPDMVYTLHVRALFAGTEKWGLWSSRMFRTKPRLRVSFGNIGADYAVLEWRRHLPKPTTEEAVAVACGRLPGLGDGEGGAKGPTDIVETEDVVYQYRFKVQRVGDNHANTYNLASTVSSFRLPNLLPSSEYRVWVCAKGLEGVWGYWSEESRVRTLTMLRLEVTNIGEDYVRASWHWAPWEGQVVEDDDVEVHQVEPAVSGYEVRAVDTEGRAVQVQPVHFSKTACTISGLELSSIYAIQVRTKDTYNQWGLWSEAVHFCTLRPVCVELTRVGEDFAAVSWSRQLVRGAGAGAGGHHHGFPMSTDGAGAESTERVLLPYKEQDVRHPDETVLQWCVRLQCSRVFAGMPEAEDYREIVVEGENLATELQSLLPQATYTVSVRGMNGAGEWGHWSPSLFITTCPLLKAELLAAGETMLHLTWTRPEVRGGVGHWGNAAAVGKAPTEEGTEEHDEGDSATADSANGESSDAQTPMAPFAGAPTVYGAEYICFPIATEVHNYKVTLRPMPNEAPFDEEDEPLVDGARVYETTQPAIRVGNLVAGTTYVLTVQEQQVDDDGVPIPDVWGAPCEAVHAHTVPPITVLTKDIGEDYCDVAWRRAAPLLDGDEEDEEFRNTEFSSVDAESRRMAEYQVHLQRLDEDGVTPYKGALLSERTIPVSGHLQTFRFTDLTHSCIYQVRVRGKSESGQWGLWSASCTFATQSRLSLSVLSVHERDVLLQWTRPKPVWAVDRMGTAPLGRSMMSMSASAEDVDTPHTNGTSTTSIASPLKRVVLGDYRVTQYEVRLCCLGVQPSIPGSSELASNREEANVDEESEDSSNSAASSRHSGPRRSFDDNAQVLTFTGGETNASIGDLRQGTIYTIAVRSMNAGEHWSCWSATTAVLTLSPVAVTVAKYTESAALLRWCRPESDIGAYEKLLTQWRAVAEAECDEEEKKELYETKRRVQEAESRGEKVTGLISQETRAELNAVRREEAINHLLAENVVLGSAECTGYELNLTTPRHFFGGVTPSIPLVVGLDQMRLNPGMGSARMPWSSSLRRVNTQRYHAASLVPDGVDGMARASISEVPQSPRADDQLSLLRVQLRPAVTEVLVQGLSPETVFAVTVRGRSGPKAWQPWSLPTPLETLPAIALEQSRFGEHYVNLYWYRTEAASMRSMREEMQEYQLLQRQFRNLTRSDLEAQQAALPAENFQRVLTALRRLRTLRRIINTRTKELTTTHPTVLAAPSTPIQGYLVRVIDESGHFTEQYCSTSVTARPSLAEKGDEASESEDMVHLPVYTATGLHPNSLYVCMLCPDYGDGLWGCWSNTLKFMTNHLIQVGVTYISENFVDIEWERMENKKLPPADAADTLVSSRYSDDMQRYQLRICHDDEETGSVVEEFRDVQASNCVRIDRLQSDIKYTIAVREWDAKGDWGLWCASVSCVTLPPMVCNVSMVSENALTVGWERAEKRVNYEHDMRVLDNTAETLGYYLRLEEVPLAEVSPDAPAEEEEDVEEEGNEETERDGDETSELSDSNAYTTTFLPPDALPNHDATTPRRRPVRREAEETETPSSPDLLEGTVAFNFQHSGPLPPDPHPVPHAGRRGPDGLYSLIKRFRSKAELQQTLRELSPSAVYKIQVRAETTGGQLGAWSDPTYVVTVPQIEVRADLIDEEYVELSWCRPPAVETVAPRLPKDVKWADVVVPSYRAVSHTITLSSVTKTDNGNAEEKVELWSTTIGEEKGMSYRITGLRASTAYGVTVHSVNAAEQQSLSSKELCFATLKPLLVSPAHISEDAMTIEWGRAEQKVAQYRQAETAEMEFGDRHQVRGYHLHVYALSESAAKPKLLLDKQLPSDAHSWTMHSLRPNNAYLACVRSANRSGVWSRWSEGRSVHTMCPLETSVSAVGEDFVRLQWSRATPDEVRCPSAEIQNKSEVSPPAIAGAAMKGESVEAVRSDISSADSPPEAAGWEQGRRFAVLDRPPAANDSGVVTSSRIYHSSATMVSAYTVSVRREGEGESEHTIEVAASLDQLTIPTLMPDSVYVVRLRACYRDGEDGPWSKTVRCGTYNLLSLEPKELGENHVAVSWQRKANTTSGSPHFGAVEETVCYEIAVRDYTDVPFGAEEETPSAMIASPRLSSFTLATQRHCVARGMAPNHRYRIAVRRWYQPLDAFREGMVEEGQPAPATTLPESAEPEVRDVVLRAGAVPGAWSEAEYVVTLRSMVCRADRVGEDFIQIHWERDPDVVPLPVRRNFANRPVQQFQLRVEECVRDGAEVSTAADTLHLDEQMPASDSSFFTPTLKPDTVYRVSVRCCIEKSWGQWSSPLHVITLPRLQMTLARLGEDCASVSWSRPLIPLTLPDGSQAVLGDEDDADGIYQLEVNGVGVEYQLAKRLKGERTSYNLKHLEADCVYAARVRASGDMGQTWSLWSDMAYFATLKPLDVTLHNPSEHFVGVEWSRMEQTPEEYAPLLEHAGCAAPGAIVQCGLPDVVAYHLCVFDANTTPSVAVQDKQFHKDTTSYRVTGLTAEAPYVIVVRACCASTETWGMWSEERPFRTQRLLQPYVTFAGETYADLSWDRPVLPLATEQRRSAVASAPPPRKYLLVVRSSDSILVEREIMHEECTVREEETALPEAEQGPQVSSFQYRINGLDIGTEYAAALQPCYGEGADWGLWSQAVHFTTLQPVEVEMSVDKTQTLQVSWGRLAPPMLQLNASTTTPAVEGEAEASKTTSAFPSHAASSGSATSKYELVVLRAEDAAQLLQMEEDLDRRGSVTVAGSQELSSKIHAGERRDEEVTVVPDMDVIYGSSASLASPNAGRVGSYRVPQYLVCKQFDIPVDAPREPKLTERVPNLCNDTVYLVRVRAMDRQQQWGAWIEQRVATPPPPPMYVSLKRVNGQYCALQWSSGVEGVSESKGSYRYVVEQSYSQAEQNPNKSGRKSHGAGAGAQEWQAVDAVDDAISCSVRIEGLLSRLRCRVKCARRLGGSGTGRAMELGPYSEYSEVVTVSSGTPPEAVGDLHLSQLSQYTAAMEWLPPPKPSEAAAGRYNKPTYRIYLANDDVHQPLTLLTTAHKPTYVLTNLLPSTTYVVQVVAENNDGISFGNPMLRFTTKGTEEADATLEVGAEPLGQLVESRDAPAVSVVVHDPEEAATTLPVIPTARRRGDSKTKTPTPPSKPLGGRSGRRKGSAKKRAGSGSGRTGSSKAKRSSSMGSSTGSLPPATARGTAKQPTKPRKAKGERGSPSPALEEGLLPPMSRTV